MHLSKHKKAFLAQRGEGANMYQFHQIHTQIYVALTLSNLIIRRIILMVLSRILKKKWLLLLKNDVFFYIPFILICNWIKQAEIVKKCGKH